MLDARPRSPLHALIACAATIALTCLGCRRAAPTTPTPAPATPTSMPAPTIINAHGTYDLTYCSRTVTIQESPNGFINISFADKSGVLPTKYSHSAYHRWMLYVEPDTTAWLYSGDTGVSLLTPGPQTAGTPASSAVFITSANMLPLYGKTIPKTFADALPDSTAKKLGIR